MFITLLTATDLDIKHSIVRCIYPLIGHRDRRFLLLLLDAGLTSSLFSALSSSHPLLNADIFTSLTALLPLSGATYLSSGNLAVAIAVLAHFTDASRAAMLDLLVGLARAGVGDQRLLAFVRPLCDDQRYRKSWDRLLAVARALIRDAERCRRVLWSGGFFEVACRLLFEKRLAVIVNAVLLIGRHFMWDNPLVEVPLARITKLAGCAHDSAARVAFWLISNLVQADSSCIEKLLAEGLLRAIDVCVTEKSIRCKFEALCALAAIVMNASQEQQTQIVRAEGVRWICRLLQIAELRFIVVAADPMLALITKPDAIDQFMTEDGLTVLEELTFAHDRALSEHAQVLLEEIAKFMRGR
jgi:hypothetical protein